MTSSVDEEGSLLPLGIDIPVVTSPHDDSSYEKIVLDINYQKEELTFELVEISQRKLFRKYRKFRARFGSMEWDIQYKHKNKVRGYDKERPKNQMIILEKVPFPAPYSKYKLDFGWWVPQSEGGPKSRGRFGFVKLFHNDTPLHSSEIGIYFGDDLSHLTPVRQQD